MRLFIILFFVLSLFLVTQTLAAQNTYGNTTNRRFEIGVTQNLLFGNNSLINFAGGFLGYNATKDIKIIAEIDFGKQLFHEEKTTQILALSIAHEYKNTDNLSFQVSLGPGLFRVKDEKKLYTLQPIALFGIQPRIYFSPRSFMGFDAKAFVGKQLSMGSFIGFNWGARF